MAIVVSVPIVFLIGHLGYNLFTDNVHTVIPGEIYRTAQLDHAGLTHYSKKFYLKTIINLRGNNPQDHWYRVEKQFATTHHINYYSSPFSAKNLPSKKQLRQLVKWLEFAPKPLAFHCKSGADRTGMAAAISVILFEKNPSINDIKRQASWHYNAISSETVGYQLMKNYFAWLKKYHFKQSRTHFLEWIFSPAKMKRYSGWFLV